MYIPTSVPLGAVPSIGIIARYCRKTRTSYETGPRAPPLRTCTLVGVARAPPDTNNQPTTDSTVSGLRVTASHLAHDFAHDVKIFEILQTHLDEDSHGLLLAREPFLQAVKM